MINDNITLEHYDETNKYPAIIEMECVMFLWMSLRRENKTAWTDVVKVQQAISLGSVL